jgi:hypothetical protein
MQPALFFTNPYIQYISGPEIGYYVLSHLVWMRKNNYIYIFVNGSTNGKQPILPQLNNLFDMNCICIGSNYYERDPGGNSSYFQGSISQFCITSGAKYDVNGFTPAQNLYPLSFDNVLFWIENDIDVKSGIPLTIYPGTLKINVNTPYYNRIYYDFTDYWNRQKFLYTTNTEVMKNINSLRTLPQWTIEFYYNNETYNYDNNYLLTSIINILCIGEPNSPFALQINASSFWTCSESIGVLDLKYNVTSIDYSHGLGIWHHVVFQYSNKTLQYILNGYVKSTTPLDFSKILLNDHTMMTINCDCMFQNQSPRKICQLRINNNIRYSPPFLIQNDLFSDGLQNCIFALGNNYNELITNTTFNYNVTPQIVYNYFKGIVFYTSALYTYDTKVVNTINSLKILPQWTIEFYIIYNGLKQNGPYLGYFLTFAHSPLLADSIRTDNGRLKEDFLTINIGDVWNWVVFVPFRDPQRLIISLGAELGYGYGGNKLDYSIGYSGADWHHVVFQNNNNNFQMYFDGQLIFNWYFNYSQLPDYSALMLNCDFMLNNSNSYGLSQLRINNNLRYNGNFTPNIDLYADGLQNCIFAMGNNYDDIISGTVFNINSDVWNTGLPGFQYRY